MVFSFSQKISSLSLLSQKPYSSLDIQSLLSLWDGRAYFPPPSTITECISLDGLINRNVLSYSSGDWKSKTKVQEGWFLLNLLSFACRWAHSHLVSHKNSSLCTHLSGIFSSSSYMDSSQIRLGPHSYYLI